MACPRPGTRPRHENGASDSRPTPLVRFGPHATTMHRPLPPLLATLALLGLPACGGGGASTPGNAVVELGSAPLAAVGGGITVATAPAPLFVPGGALVATWFDASGTAQAAGQVVASSREHFGLLAPLLPAGLYRVDVDLGGTTGRVSVQLTEAASVANPLTAVSAWISASFARIATLRTAALLLTDPELRAARVADLDEMQRHLQFSLVHNWIELPAEMEAALRLLGSVPAEVELDTSGALASGLGEIEVDHVRAAGDRLRSGADLMAYGATVLTAVGHDAFGPAELGNVVMPLPSTVAVVLALLAYYEGVDRFADGMARPVKPRSALQIDGATADGGPNPIVTLGTVSLVADVPLQLGSTAEFDSLVASDRQSPSPEVRELFVPIDGAHRALGEWHTAVTGLFHTLPAPLPEVPRTARQSVSASRLRIESQSNPQVVLTLVDGRLNGSSPGGASTGTTEATFAYDSGPFGVMTRTVTVRLVVIRPNMVPIAAGTFSMGSETPAAVPASPVHTVTISRPFWMGKFEVTQPEYQQFLGENPSFFPGPTLPVERVHWDEAAAFCAVLTSFEAATGRLPSGYEYRLPTEAEWEYCCRAGTTTEWSFGNSVDCSQANVLVDGAYCVPGHVVGGQTSPVGTYAANPWGLHDMHGNVAEWCLDSGSGDFSYPAEPVSDPFEATGFLRILRGGSWASDASNSRSWARFWSASSIGSPYPGSPLIGFRVVCAPARP